jgi:hypothetical protein
MIDGKKAKLKVKQGDKWVEYAPVIYATWTLNNYGKGTCSNCNFTQANVWDYDNYQQYCGVCGAKMSLED